jgi:methyl-accepting chemotaxis protein
VWIQASYNPIVDAQGAITRVVKFCTDITVAKIAASETAARLAALSASSCLIEFDGSGRILAANERMLQALGCSAADLIGKAEEHILFEGTQRDPAYQERWALLR